MTKMLLVMTTGALIAFATAFSASAASAHERCVCTSTIPVPPVPAVAPVPPVPPVAGRHHIRKQVIIIDPSGNHRTGHRRIVRVVSHGDGRMTREEFVRRAEHAFDEHDTDDDGVLEDDERADMADEEDDDAVIVEAPEPPEAVEPPEPPEPPEAPEPPEPPRHHR